MAFATKVREGGDFKPFPRGLKDGNNRRRVLPGIHTCSADGTWAKKYSTHTYKVPREEDPEKFDYYTFNCVEVVEWVNREKVVLETCPECVLIADQNDEFEKLRAKLKEELKSGLKSKDEVRKLLRPFIEWKKRHGRSFWWAVNTQDGDGKYGTDKWPNDVKKQYDVIKKKLKDEDDIGAILPLEQGVWVDIVKTPGNETGTGFPEYNVEVVMERLEGGLKRIKLAPLAPEAAEEAEKSCWDLNDPGVLTLSRDQVKALASSGDAATVIRGIFKQSQRKSEPTPPAPSPEAKGETKLPPKSEPGPKPETEDDRIMREAQDAIARIQARRVADRKTEVGGAGPLNSTLPPKSEPTPPAPSPEAKGETKPPPKGEPEPKKDGADEDIDKFMKEYELEG